MNVGNVLNAGFEIQYLLGNGLIQKFSQTIDIYVLKWGISQGAVSYTHLDVFVNDVYCMTADPHKNNWLHCNAVLLFWETESRSHKVRITVTEEDQNKKFTILGFGYTI